MGFTKFICLFLYPWMFKAGENSAKKVHQVFKMRIWWIGGNPLFVRISAVAQTAIEREIIQESSMNVNYNARITSKCCMYACENVQYLLFIRISIPFFCSRFSSIEQWSRNKNDNDYEMKVNKNSIMLKLSDKKTFNVFISLHTHLNDYCTFPIWQNDWTYITCKMTHSVGIHWQIFPF